MKGSRLSISAKFGLIALVSLLPLAFTLTLWLVEIGERTAQLDREREGLALHGAIEHALVAVLRHRDAAVGLRLRGAASGEAADAAAAEVQRGLAAAGEAAAAVDWAREIAAQISESAVAWDVVRRGLGNRTAEETWTEHGELATLNLLPRLSETGRRSGLYGDADPVGYYLARIAIERLPQLAHRLGEARSLVDVVASVPAAASAGLDKLQVGVALAQADLDAIDADAKDLLRIAPSLGELKVPFAELDQAGNRFLRTAENSIGVARAGRADWAAVRSVAAPVEKAHEAYERARRAFSGRLADRRAELVERRNLLLALALGVVGIAALFGLMLMRSVKRGIGGALAVADRVASGDLSQVVEADGQDETARLLRSLGTMNQALARMVGEVRAVADSVGLEARNLAGGNRDLSERTESQASAIEEAASSMEELTASVRQNMDSARETTRLTVSASEATARGIEAASRAVGHMESIREGTRRVGEIVGMIDSIAFQTNILALNAAVEAARAGEHGRGFAVVAAEVRSLARRCAESAREIKGLVAASSEQAGEGEKLVDEVAEAIGEINGRVKQVGELMNGVVGASTEQASGIEQVSQTITQMERMTQQNAAMVEEVLAATEALERQTERLAAAVGAFRLAGGVSPEAGTAPRRVPGAKPPPRLGRR